MMIILTMHPCFTTAIGNFRLSLLQVIFKPTHLIPINFIARLGNIRDNRWVQKSFTNNYHYNLGYIRQKDVWRSR